MTLGPNACLQTLEMLSATVKTGSHLLSRGQRSAWADLDYYQQREAATRLLVSLEDSAFALAQSIAPNEKIVLAQDDLRKWDRGFVINVIAPHDINYAECCNVSPRDNSGSVSISFAVMSVQSLKIAEGEKESLIAFPSEDERKMWGRDPGVTLELPYEALKENSDQGVTKVTFFVYDNLEEILSGVDDGFPRFLPDSPRLLNSRVISASLGQGRHIQLSHPVRMRFKHLLTDNVSEPKCVFWDFTTSAWSSDGCTVLRWDAKETSCECRHLTNFAILMDIHAESSLADASSHRAPYVIIYVGCGVAIFFLLAATLTFYHFQSPKVSRRARWQGWGLRAPLMKWHKAGNGGHETGTLSDSRPSFPAS